MLWRHWTAVFALVAVLVSSALAQTFNGNLLPGVNDLPKKISEIQSTAADHDQVQAYVGNASNGPLKKTATFECPGFGKVGDLVFEHAAYTGNYGGGGPNTAGGMVVRGGLKLAPLVQVKPGYTLRWLQVYKETGGSGKTTVDGADPLNPPLYPDHTLTGFTPLFFDSPADVFTNPNAPDKIEFHTALVCFKNDEPKKLKSFGVFQWSYEIDKANKTIKNDTLTLPNFPSPLTALLSNTFDAEFGANGTRGKGWTLQEASCPDCFVVVPEPGTLALFALGAMPLWRSLRRQRLAA